MVDDVESYRSLLSIAATRLSGDRRVPISVRAICSILGVRVRRSPDRLKPVLVRTAASNLEIVLPRRNLEDFGVPRRGISSPAVWGLEARERWWVAHEIGHFILHQSRVPAPLGSEYWPFEDLCDDFAGQLLAPDHSLHEVVEDTLTGGETAGQDPVSWLNATDILSSSAFIPWELASCRVHRWRQNAWFFTLRRQADNRLRVTFSALRNRKELRAVVRENDPLGKFIADMRQNSIGRLNSSQLAPLKSQMCAITAAVKKLSDKTARVAIYGDPSPLSALRSNARVRLA